MLLWMWCRSAATPSIGPLAQELPYAVGSVLKSKKKKKEYLYSSNAVATMHWVSGRAVHTPTLTHTMENLWTLWLLLGSRVQTTQGPYRGWPNGLRALTIGGLTFKKKDCKRHASLHLKHVGHLQCPGSRGNGVQG